MNPIIRKEPASIERVYNKLVRDKILATTAQTGEALLKNEFFEKR